MLPTRKWFGDIFFCSYFMYTFNRVMKFSAKSAFYLCMVFGIASVQYSCNNSSDDHSAVLKGKFVNQTFLDQVPDSIAGFVHAYCYEMDFISEDSVRIFYGFEEATLKYKKDGTDYVVEKAMQDKDMPFKINDNGTITLTDSTWNESHENSVFFKSDMRGGKWNFEKHLNEKMIAGEYTLYKNGQPTDQRVAFTPGGNVTGLENFVGYSICYSGDCVGETYPIANNITFTNDQNNKVVYAFDINRETGSIRINNIEPPIPDTKGERAIKDLAFDLRK